MNREQIANKYNLIIDNHNDKMVINAMVAIKKHNMEKWLREFDEPNGFIMSSHSNISILQTELADDGHSGCSASCTLRVCQSLLTKDYNELILEDMEDVENIENIENIENGKDEKPIILCENMDCERYPPDWDFEEDTEETYQEDQWKKCSLCDGYYNDDGMGDILFVQEEPNNQEAECDLCGKTEDIVQMKGCGQYLCGDGCDESGDDENP
jgi:hypothetical protein